MIPLLSVDTDCRKPEAKPSWSWKIVVELLAYWVVERASAEKLVVTISPNWLLPWLQIC